MKRDHNLLLTWLQSIPMSRQYYSVREYGFGSLLISTFSHSSLPASYGILQELNLFKSQFLTVGKQNNNLSITKGITTQIEVSSLAQ